MNHYKEARKRKGISQAMLSAQIGVSQGSISQWEIGKTEPDVQNILKLADLYGVSTDYLLGRTDNPLSAIPADTPYMKVTPFEKTIVEAYRDLSTAEQVIAPSDTATLLRLHPNHQFYLRRRPPCG